MFALICLLLAADPSPLPSAHSHNDYEQKRPLRDALDQGFCSVEADIWLTPQGLLVAHDRKDFKPERTLERLYLTPLRERAKAHGGKIYPKGPTFWLLIDVKSEAIGTYAALHDLLKKYDDILSITRDGKHEVQAVTVVLSGNRARETVTKQTTRYVGLDGRPEDLDSDLPADLMPWISASWGSLFRWRGDGPMPDAERARLREHVAKAHARGRKVRFWATPENQAVWAELTDAKVDLLNTDQLAELATYLQKRK